MLIVVFACLMVVQLALTDLSLAAEVTGPPEGLSLVRHGEMTVPRAAHQATPMGTGRVLVTGGCSADGCQEILASTEVYDPESRSFRTAAPMQTPRASHAALPLLDGRVLIAGGWTGSHSIAKAETYNPAQGGFTPAGDMHSARMGTIAVPLPDGRVLIAGGEVRTGTALASAEIFDPNTNAFSETGVMGTPRAGHAAVALADGRVLVTGGNRGGGQVLRSAEIFDPSTGEFHSTGEMRNPRHKHAAVLLSDGRVLIIGGSDENDSRGLYASTEFFDPSTGEFATGPELHSARFKLRDAAVAFPSGGVFVGGGAAQSEWWDPAERIFRPVSGKLSGPRMFATVTLLPDGNLLLLGGYDERIQPSAAAWRIRSAR